MDIKAYRHGDVVIKRRATLPEAKKKKEQLEKMVLAEGEVTGHSHRVVGDATLYKIDDVLWLSVGEKGATVTHEEHRAIELEPGVFEIGIQREYSPEGWTAVKD